jgi:ABC-type multidrug transport system fused ATPase/permease subunit
VAGFTLWLNGFVEAANNLRTSTISVKEYRKCLDMKNQLNHGEGRDVSKLDAPFSIEFKNVSFAYPGAEKPTIENLSFKISPGEKVALVGDNGAGKTTIIKLLTGLYIAGEGEILINGYDIHSFNISDYMSLFSVVFQDSEPLSLTIENIITCQRNKEVDQERLYDALEKSGLKEKVLSLERKENTYLTQMFDLSGIRLSGGETQKLMLARALYKDAPLLILDEPTAALDPLAEERMYLQYDKLTEYNTSLFISHRLASTKFCDRVFFLEQGKIVEKGSHDELITLNKKYKETFDIQAKYYKENYDEKN